MKQILVAIFTGTVAFGQSLPPVCPNGANGQQAVSIVSAADYGSSSSEVAPGSIVSMFALNMAAGVFEASDQSPETLPTSLGGVSATITDSLGQTFPISFMAVTQGQANAILPNGLAISGQLLPTVYLTTSGGAKICGTVSLNTVVPSLFSADNTGGWLAAAQVVTTHSDGSQTFMDSVAQYSSTLVYNGSTWSHWIPKPISIGLSTDVSVLELFGTGIRGISVYTGALFEDIPVGPLVTVNPCILYTAGNGQSCDLMPALTVLYAGPQGAGKSGSFYGLDQINVVLPQSLAGSGMTVMEVTVVSYCAGCGGPGGPPWELLSANWVQVYIQ